MVFSEIGLIKNGNYIRTFVWVQKIMVIISWSFENGSWLIHKKNRDGRQPMVGWSNSSINRPNNPEIENDERKASWKYSSVYIWNKLQIDKIVLIIKISNTNKEFDRYDSKKSKIRFSGNIQYFPTDGNEVKIKTSRHWKVNWYKRLYFKYANINVKNETLNDKMFRHLQNSIGVQL